MDPCEGAIKTEKRLKCYEAYFDKEDKIDSRSKKVKSKEKSRKKKGKVGNRAMKCYNSDRNCEKWSKKGYCLHKKYQKYMAKHCTLSCDLCKDDFFMLNN